MKTFYSYLQYKQWREECGDPEEAVRCVGEGAMHWPVIYLLARDYDRLKAEQKSTVINRLNQEIDSLKQKLVETEKERDDAQLHAELGWTQQRYWSEKYITCAKQRDATEARLTVEQQAEIAVAYEDAAAVMTYVMTTTDEPICTKRTNAGYKVFTGQADALASYYAGHIRARTPADATNYLNHLITQAKADGMKEAAEVADQAFKINHSDTAWMIRERCKARADCYEQEAGRE